MTTGIDPTDRVLTALRSQGLEPKRSTGGWSCRCPAHDDRRPSLSIGTGDNGRALLKCHAGCPTPDVLAVLGLTMRDLMPSNGHTHASPERGTSRVTETPLRNATERGFGDTRRKGEPRVHFPTAQDAIAELERCHGPRSQAWTYTDSTGDPVGVVLRWDCEGGKRIRPVARNGTGWVVGGMASPRPLYALAALTETPPETCVFVTEGEKAADAIQSCGLIATTSAHGSRSAAKTDWSPLSDRDVVILPDRDAAGETYASDVLDLAWKAGARSVRIARLAEQWPALQEGGDAADVLALLGGDVEGFRQELESFVRGIAPEERPAGSLRFEPFPLDALPEPVRTYVTQGAASIGCDVSFLAVPMLAGLASAIGNTRRIALKRSWTEPAIIWAAIVGESGTAKSPALEMALRPIRSRQHKAMREHARAIKEWETEHARWEADLATWKKTTAKSDKLDPPPEPLQPTCERTWIDDTTIEALVSRLQENPRGLLMVRDELAGWFNFDRYAGGKGGGDAAKWLEVFGGRALIVDRKTSGTEYVPSASVSIAGGIQPETLRRALGKEHRDSGLAARLLFASPPRRPKRWTEDDVSEDIELALSAVFEQLYSLKADINDSGDLVPRLLHLTLSAKRVWVSFVNEHGAEQADRVGEEAAAWSKLEGYAARFALVIHLTRVAAGDGTIKDHDTIDEASVGAGVNLVRWFAHEAERVYALLAGEDQDREQAQLLEWVDGRGGEITPAQVARGVRRFRGKIASARDTLDQLVHSGHGRWEHPCPGPKGGRPVELFISATRPWTAGAPT